VCFDFLYKFSLKNFYSKTKIEFKKVCFDFLYNFSLKNFYSKTKIEFKKCVLIFSTTLV